MRCLAVLSSAIRPHDLGAYRPPVLRDCNSRQWVLLMSSAPGDEVPGLVSQLLSGSSALCTAVSSVYAVRCPHAADRPPRSLVATATETSGSYLMPIVSEVEADQEPCRALRAASPDG